MDVVEYERGRRRMCRTNVLKKGSCKECRKEYWLKEITDNA